MMLLVFLVGIKHVLTININYLHNDHTKSYSQISFKKAAMTTN